MDIEQLRSFCLRLPAVTEDIKWHNDLVFSVGGKMFCATSLEPPFKCSFKVPDEEFEELSQQDGFLSCTLSGKSKMGVSDKPTKIV
ncbi:MAG: MmcQ/YjbR family DNA-binding protein [Chitinophagaceae bacterium]